MPKKTITIQLYDTDELIGNPISMDVPNMPEARRQADKALKWAINLGRQPTGATITVNIDHPLKDETAK